MSENVTTEELEQENAAAAAKAEKRRQKQKDKSRKVLVTTTYFLAVLCLLCGLLVPIFQIDGKVSADNMMLRYIPSMFNQISNQIIHKDLIPVTGWFGTFDGNVFMSVIGVLYAVVCVLSVIMFVPVFLGSRKKNTSANAALIVEILALLVTGAYIATATYFIVSTGDISNFRSWKDYNFLLAFGGALLMAIIQTVASKGSIGVSKIIAVILSVIGVFALLDVTMFLPFMATPLDKLSEILKCDQAGFVGGLSNWEGKTNFLGIDGFNLLIHIKDSWGSIINPAVEGATPDIVKIIVYILLIAVSIFTLANLVIDIIGLGTGKKFNKDRSPCRNKGSNTFALVRYILTIVFAAAIIILITFLMEDVNVGVYLYLLIAVLFIEIINAVVRTACANARAKKGNLAPSTQAQESLVIEDPAFSVEPEREPVREAEPQFEREQVVEEQPAQPEYEQPSFYEEPVAEPYVPVEEPAPVVIEEPLTAPLEEVEQPEEPTPTVYIYGGDTDDFMETLTDTEKVEFVEVFVKKSKGKVNGVPDYEIGGDNGDFFPAVFVHINRYRNIVSDALMSKMYKQLGKLS